MLSLSSPRLHGFCGWVRMGAAHLLGREVLWGMVLCVACIWVVSVVHSPPSYYDLVDFSLVSAVVNLK
jgi:hypothetical protein